MRRRKPLIAPLIGFERVMRIKRPAFSYTEAESEKPPESVPVAVKEVPIYRITEL